LEYTKRSLLTKDLPTLGMTTMTNYGLEILFWVILGTFVIYSIEENKKK